MLALPADPIDPKVAALKEVQQSMQSVAQLGGGGLAVKGVYRLAVAFDHLGTAIGSLPAPSRLSSSDQAKVLAAFAQQAQGLHNQAIQAFDACASKGRELQVVDSWVSACASHTVVSEPLPEMSVASPPAMSAGVSAARAELKWGAPDADKIDALGVAQLGAGDYRRARLTFQRALEVEASRASSLAGLGAALVHIGEMSAAEAAFHQALALDGANDRAHAGMALLLCQAGDMDKGKAELAAVKEKDLATEAESRCGGAR
jgi:tetratricopeptide (TPR) repeat protein